MNTLVPGLPLPAIIPAVSWTERKLIKAKVILRHLSTIRLPFPSRLITSNFSVVLMVFLPFFTQTALDDVDLHFSHILVPNASAVGRGTTSVTWLYHQHNQTICVTDGMTVTSLSASVQPQTSAAKDRLRQIALNRKISRIVYDKSR